MEYEWDEAKRLENLAKHRIDFADVEEFDWNRAITDSSPRNAELRFIAVSFIGTQLRVLIFTMRGNRRRVISLRPPSRQETRRYEQARRDSERD